MESQHSTSSLGSGLIPRSHPGGGGGGGGGAGYEANWGQVLPEKIDVLSLIHTHTYKVIPTSDWLDGPGSAGQPVWGQCPSQTALGEQWYSQKRRFTWVPAGHRIQGIYVMGL